MTLPLQDSRKKDTVLALRPVPRDRIDLVAGVQVAAEQRVFTGTVAQAFRSREGGIDFHGVFRGERAVGFFKIDRRYARRYTFAALNDLGLRAFMIDLSHQGQGLGTAATAMLGPYIRAAYPEAATLWLTVNKSNPAAIRAYGKGGFTDTGKMWLLGNAGPQHIMRLPLPPANAA
ncbi:MAG: GNAT family N-acetyltransferase [Pseudomonadota bacterium]